MTMTSMRSQSIGSPVGKSCGLRTSQLLLLAVVGSLVGCRSIPERNPLPVDLADQAVIFGIPKVRNWGDEPSADVEEWLTQSEEDLVAGWGGIMDLPHSYLALSGGGANGAFGAGLLCGWTAHGDRPIFTVVTGISSGALIAPFAFLGSDYDIRLRHLLTMHCTEEMVEERSMLETLTGDSVMNTDGMIDIIEEFFNQDLLDAVAEASLGGRELLVATTNLDAGRPVIWNLSRIAKSGMPGSLKLFQKIIYASTAIPIAFPPVMIDVEVDGVPYDEMHVDGGATTQVFWFPIQVHWSRVTERLRVKGTPNVYVIRNGLTDSRWKTIPRELITIAMRSFDTLIRTQGVGDLYKIYVAAKRDGLDFHLASIPTDFTHPETELFDKAYMQALFSYAYKLAEDDYPWANAPEGVD
ncbi:MAG: putative patatin/cPLA2 family phospholipase [Planctomycetota bacterium]|jgi:predicted patatin/cPLA2 family phospholipase